LWRKRNQKEKEEEQGKEQKQIEKKVSISPNLPRKDSIASPSPIITRKDSIAPPSPIITRLGRTHTVGGDHLAGDIEVYEALGEGHFGSVFRGTMNTDLLWSNVIPTGVWKGNEVALKLLKSEEYAKQFESEANLL
jgi:hypothetical protein